MSKDTEEAESVVQINEHKLDRECVRLPSDYLQYAHRAVEAKRDHDELKAELSVLEAEIGKRIRDTPGKYGLEKDTEKAVAATILLQSEYQEKQAEVSKARFHADMVQAVVSALEVKKRTLTLLVDLHGMGYFSNVKASTEGKAAVKEMMYGRAKRRDED